MAGITTHYSTNGVEIGLGSGDLLDMLAEVATQTLQQDLGLNGIGYFAAQIVQQDPRLNTTKKAETKIIHSVQTDASVGMKSTNKNKPSVPVEKVNSSVRQLTTLSANRLIKAFSQFDGNEMRRTFTYTCTFEPEHCHQSFASFGSEGKARQLMKTHLLYHVRQTEQKARGVPFSIQATKKGRKKQIFVGANTSNNKPNINHLNHSKAISSRLPLWKTDISIRKETVPKAGKNHTLPSILESYLNDEHSTGTHVIYKKALIDEGTSVGNDHNYTMVKDDLCSVKKHEDESDSLVGNEEVYESVPTVYNVVSGELEKFMLGEVYDDTILVAYVESDQVQLMQLPHVGQEVAISTSDISSTDPSDEICKIEIDEDSDRKDRSPVDMTDATVIFDGDSVQFKKPRGKPRFITQSKADQDKAIAMIEAAKVKGSSLDPLECHICQPPRQFTALTTLISHYRSHAGIKPYECRICSQAFTRQHSLNYHMLIHSNSTRFTCSDCGRKFRHPSHFKEHLRRHSGEAPFECVDCLIRFKTRNTFKRHLKTRHGKVLTNTGGLLTLTEEEFTQVRTSPRSQSFVNDKSWQEGEQIVEERQTSSKVVVSNKEVDKENTISSERLKKNSKLVVPKTKLNIDIIEEAMTQSDISYHEDLYSNADMDIDYDNNKSAFLSVQSAVVETINNTVDESITESYKSKGFSSRSDKSYKSYNRPKGITPPFPNPVELTYNLKVNHLNSSYLAINKLKYSKVFCTKSQEVQSPIIFNFSLGNTSMKSTLVIGELTESTSKLQQSTVMLLNDVANNNNNNLFCNSRGTEIALDHLNVQA